METYLTGIIETLTVQIGKTVTIFTTSGGMSGSGFTGVLLSCDCNYVRLLATVGAPPSCPIGSACTGYQTFGGQGNEAGYQFQGNPLGAICVIPTRAIACFTHNAI